MVDASVRKEFDEMFPAGDPDREKAESMFNAYVRVEEAKMQALRKAALRQQRELAARGLQGSWYGLMSGGVGLYTASQANKPRFDIDRCDVDGDYEEILEWDRSRNPVVRQEFRLIGMRYIVLMVVVCWVLSLLM